MSLVAWFADVGKSDVPVVGGKGANLGELTRAGIQVPPGFVITSGAYDDALRNAGLRAGIKELLGRITGEPASAKEASILIRQMFEAVTLSPPLAKAILSSYKALGGGYVAVRSSATAEDLAEASFAGQQSSYLNVAGDAQLLTAVEDCWASLFEEHAIAYRARQEFDHLEAKMAVVVQKMVQAHRAGVIFTVNPVTGDDGQMVIEAAYGLGEGVVSGILTPDMYIIDKNTAAVVSSEISEQDRELVRDENAIPGGDPNHWLRVDPVRGRAPKLNAEELQELARLALLVEAHYGRPQDIEWAEADGRFYILQARPVTTVGL